MCWHGRKNAPLKILREDVEDFFGLAFEVEPSYPSLFTTGFVGNFTTCSASCFIDGVQIVDFN